MGDLARTPTYANFRAWVPRNTIPVGPSATLWTYYDWGPRSYATPLLCLHGAAGAADVFHAQVLGVAAAGYRVLSAELPPYWTLTSAVDGLCAFLDTLRLRAVHVYGAGLGGYIGLALAGRRPERVLSLVLTHAFVSPGPLRRASPYSPAVLRWLPEPLVRAAFAPLIPGGVAPLPIARAVEFVAARVAEASRDALASRLALLAADSSLVGKLSRVRSEAVTRLDAADRGGTGGTGGGGGGRGGGGSGSSSGGGGSSSSSGGGGGGGGGGSSSGGGGPPATSPVAVMDAALAAALPGSREAFLKGGGDFPYLAAPDVTTMHIVVHLRRHGAPPVEASALPPLPPPARVPPPPAPRPPAVVPTITGAGSDAAGRSASSPGVANGGGGGGEGGSDGGRKPNPLVGLVAAVASVAAHVHFPGITGGSSPGAPSGRHEGGAGGGSSSAPPGVVTGAAVPTVPTVQSIHPPPVLSGGGDLSRPPMTTSASDEAVARLAEFLPDRSTPFLAAVVADTAGDVQAALTAILDNRYPPGYGFGGDDDGGGTTAAAASTAAIRTSTPPPPPRTAGGTGATAAAVAAAAAAAGVPPPPPPPTSVADAVRATAGRRRHRRPSPAAAAAADGLPLCPRARAGHGGGLPALPLSPPPPPPPSARPSSQPAETPSLPADGAASSPRPPGAATTTGGAAGGPPSPTHSDRSGDGEIFNPNPLVPPALASLPPPPATGVSSSTSPARAGGSHGAASAMGADMVSPALSAVSLGDGAPPPPLPPLPPVPAPPPRPAVDSPPTAAATSAAAAAADAPLPAGGPADPLRPSRSSEAGVAAATAGATPGGGDAGSGNAADGVGAAATAGSEEEDERLAAWTRSAYSVNEVRGKW
ncbi:hypothetical protein MMPV_001148 [Pyropia vietnamensis]